MILNDSSLKFLIGKKREMIKNEDDKKKIEKIDMQIRAMTESFIEKEKEQFKKNGELIKMKQEKVEEKVKALAEKPGKKVQPDSYTMLIVKALSMKSVNTLDKVIDKINDWKPGRDIKKLQTQIKSVIRMVKQQSTIRWQKYDWNEDKYLLTEKVKE